MGIGGQKPSLITAEVGASHRQLPSPDLAGGNIEYIEMPSDLSTGAQAVWGALMPPLFDARVLREEDLMLLIEACEAWALTAYFRKSLWVEIEGMNDSNEVKRLRSGWSQSLAHAKSLMSELGIGPVNRIRLGLGRGDASGGLLSQLVTPRGLDDE